MHSPYGLEIVERCATCDQMIGSMSRTNVADPAAFERANYMKMLASYKKF